MRNDTVRRIRIILNKLVSADIKNESTKGFQHIASRTLTHGSEHAFRIPIGLDYRRIQRCIGALSANLGAPVELEDHFGVVVVRVIEEDFPKELKHNIKDLKKGYLLIGYTRMREPKYHVFNKSFLAAGAAGGGKTDLLRWLIFQMRLQNFIIKVVDMKGFSFFPFELYGLEVATDLKKASKMLESAYKEMMRRTKIIKKYRDRSLVEEFPPLAVIIDEAAQISPSQNTSNKESHELAKYCDEICAKIAQMGREPKVLLIYTTQRPDRNIINPQVKANVDVAIAFRTKTASNSMIILDRPGAEKIRSSTPGRCIYSGDGEDLYLQVPYIGNDEAWEKLLAEMLQHERTPRKDSQSALLRSLGIHATIGGTQSEFKPKEKSIAVVQGIGARWTPKQSMAREREGMATFQERKEADEYTDEISEEPASLVASRSGVF